MSARCLHRLSTNAAYSAPRSAASLRCHARRADHDGRPGGLTSCSLPRYRDASSPAAMSSETTAELADLVHEWLRIDQVRVDNVPTLWFDTKSQTSESRILSLSGRFRTYGLLEILKN